MDYSMDDTMKKIKQQEKETEEKLRQKRTCELVVMVFIYNHVDH